MDHQETPAEGRKGAGGRGGGGSSHAARGKHVVKHQEKRKRLVNPDIRSLDHGKGADVELLRASIVLRNVCNGRGGGSR